jgi:uncharacterized protein (DUF2461 family)
MSPRDLADEHARYKLALEQIERMKRTPRAYRHQKFEKLVEIAREALRLEDE